MDAVEVVLRPYVNPWFGDAVSMVQAFFARFALLRFLVATLRALYALVFVRPLALLYFRGPWLYGWGAWAGATMPDICTALTPGVPSSHWAASHDECAAMVRRRFDSLLVTVQVTLYAYVLYRLVAYAWCRLSHYHLLRAASR